MTIRFSKEELHEIRNSISVRMVIERIVNLPSKVVEGVFRFLCPVCGEFQTSIHQKTNLSRCFLCKRNFNSIDLVMEVKHKNFVESVKLLKRYITHKNNTHAAFLSLSSSSQTSWGVLNPRHFSG